MLDGPPTTRHVRCGCGHHHCSELGDYCCGGLVSLRQMIIRNCPAGHCSGATSFCSWIATISNSSGRGLVVGRSRPRPGSAARKPVYLTATLSQWTNSLTARLHSVQTLLLLLKITVGSGQTRHFESNGIWQSDETSRAFATPSLRLGRNA